MRTEPPAPDHRDHRRDDHREQRLAEKDRAYGRVIAEDPHFGAGETTDDGDIVESARREWAELRRSDRRFDA